MVVMMMVMKLRLMMKKADTEYLLCARCWVKKSVSA